VDEGLLGVSEEHAVVAGVDEPLIDEALDLQVISIHLRKSLISSWAGLSATGAVPA